MKPEKNLERTADGKTNLVDQINQTVDTRHLEAAKVHELFVEALRVAEKLIQVTPADRASLKSFIKKIERAGDRTAKEQLRDYLEVFKRLDKQVVALYEELSNRFWDEYAKAQEESQAYLKMEAELLELEKDKDAVLSELFSNKSASPAMLRHRLGQITSRIGELKKKMAAEREKNGKLATFLEYRRTTRYAEALNYGEYVVTESRSALIDRIRQAILESRGTPLILLTGSSGSGKTSIANFVARLLTGKDATGVVAGANTDVTKLFGSRLSGGTNGFYVAYGPLGQVITGRKSNDDAAPVDPKDSRIGFIDEITLMLPETQTEFIKICASAKPGRELQLERLTNAGLSPVGSIAIIMATNVKSEGKHPDRNDIPPEALREFAARIKVPYLDQEEIYEIFKAALMDENCWMTVSEEDIKVPWKEIVYAKGGRREFVIDKGAKCGGLIWKLAHFVAEAQKAYEEDENVLSATLGPDAILRKAVPDISKFIEMLYNYRITRQGSNQGLSASISKFLDQWIGHEKDTAGQESLPAEDRKFLVRLREAFGLDANSLSKPPRPFRILSPMEIGAISPRILPGESVDLGNPTTDTVFGRDGTPYEIKRGPVGSVPEGEEMVVKKGNKKAVYKVLGTVDQKGKIRAALYNQEDEDLLLIDPADLEKDYEHYFGTPATEQFGKVAVRVYGDIDEDEEGGLGNPDDRKGFIHKDSIDGDRVSIRPAIFPIFIPDEEPLVKRPGIISAKKRVVNNLIEEVEHLGTTA